MLWFCRTNDPPASEEQKGENEATGLTNTYNDEQSIEYFKWSKCPSKLFVIPVLVSPVVCLKNILSEDDLKEQALYDELYEDIKFELEKFGPIEKMVIPRQQDINVPGPASSSTQYSPNSLCRVYIEYKDISAAFGAYNLMNGRVFNSKPLEIIFYDRDTFHKNILN